MKTLDIHVHSFTLTFYQGVVALKFRSSFLSTKYTSLGANLRWSELTPRFTLFRYRKHPKVDENYYMEFNKEKKYHTVFKV